MKYGQTEYNNKCVTKQYNNNNFSIFFAIIKTESESICLFLKHAEKHGQYLFEAMYGFLCLVLIAGWFCSTTHMWMEIGIFWACLGAHNRQDYDYILCANKCCCSSVFIVAISSYTFGLRIVRCMRVAVGDEMHSMNE